MGERRGHESASAEPRRRGETHLRLYLLLLNQALFIGGRAGLGVFWSVLVPIGSGCEDHSVQHCSGGGGGEGCWSHRGAFLSPAGLISSTHLNYTHQTSSSSCVCVWGSPQCSTMFSQGDPRAAKRGCLVMWSTLQPIRAASLTTIKLPVCSIFWVRGFFFFYL